VAAAIEETKLPKTYWPSAVLLAAGIGIGIVSVELFPSERPTPAPGALGFVVAAPSPVVDFNVYETRSAGNVTAINLVATTPAGEDAEVPVYLSYPTDKNSPTCQVPSMCQHYPNRTLPLEVDLVDDNPGPPGTLDVASAWVYFSGPPLGFASDAASATAQLPAVQVPLNVPSQQYLNGAVELHYALAAASSYQWTTGQAPNSLDQGYLTWYLNLQPQGSVSVFESLASSAGGINLAEQQHQQLLTFLAGALLGVAGGALIGALQEFFHARREAGRRTTTDLTP